jgi:DNA-3-methyladenine glycosylase II
MSPDTVERRTIGSSVAVRERVSRSRFDWPVAAPYRLDLTVSALRRLSTNIVDVLTPDGQYMRALSTTRGPIVTRVMQVHPGCLTIVLDGDSREHGSALETMQRILGARRDLAHFDRAASRMAWLRPLAERMRGVRPPRYPTLWEACVNAVVFQQVSLYAASAIVRRLITSLGESLESDGIPLYTFPTVERFLAAHDDVLREAGLSPGKLSTLRRIGGELAAGTLGEEMLEARDSRDAAALLCGIKGIGPWTASVILLRGLGRLDVFPMRDSGVARNLALFFGSEHIDLAATLQSLSPQEGMLYYHLLLARLELRADLGRPSVLRTIT